VVARLTCVVCASLLFGSLANAQPGSIHVTPYAGVAVPTGDFADLADTGFHTGAQFELDVGPRWSVVLDGFWSRFGTDVFIGDSLVAQRHDHTSILAGALEMKYRVSGGPVWVLGGFGTRRIEEPRVKINVTFHPDSTGYAGGYQVGHVVETKWRFALNLGAGGELRLSEQASAMVEGMMDFVPMRGVLAVRAGLRIRLR